MLFKSLLKISFTIALISFYGSSNAQFDTTVISAQLSRSKEKQAKDAFFVLAKEGKVLYKKEMGDLNLKTKVPIGASSQWLTTALVMVFVQEGKISLDDKVSTYLPIFNKTFKSYITIRQCLTHYTGIQSEVGVAKILQKNKFHSLEEEVNNFASKRDIETNAGTAFKYSNVGPNIAGRVLEIVAKKPFDRIMQDKIIRPLAMKNTTFTNEDFNDAINPSTGATSSGADFINFLTMLLNKGTFNTKQILTPASVEMMHTLQAEAQKITLAPKIVEGLNYGLGEWILEADANGKATAVTVPSLQAFVPVIDICRGYAFVVYSKTITGEQNKNAFTTIKETIDDQINCRQ